MKKREVYKGFHSDYSETLSPLGSNVTLCQVTNSRACMLTRGLFDSQKLDFGFHSNQLMNKFSSLLRR